MDSELKLYGVGGAACLAPETCQTRGCERPAEVLEGVRTTDPARNRVAGHCRECAGVIAARAAWLAGLTPEDRAERERLYQARYDVRHDRESAWADVRAQAPQRERAAREDLNRFLTRTGYPAHPRGLNPAGA